MKWMDITTHKPTEEGHYVVMGRDGCYLHLVHYLDEWNGEFLTYKPCVEGSYPMFWLKLPKCPEFELFLSQRERSKREDSES